MSIRSRIPPFKKRAYEKIELIELPYCSFQVKIVGGRGDLNLTILVDALSGSIAVLEMENLVISEVNKSPEVPLQLDLSQARRKIEKEYRWALIGAGLKGKKKYKIGYISEGELLLYPFWVGYYRKSGKLDFEAVDGVSGRLQGSDVRRLIFSALCNSVGD